MPSNLSLSQSLHLSIVPSSLILLSSRNHKTTRLWPLPWKLLRSRRGIAHVTCVSSQPKRLVTKSENTNTEAEQLVRTLVGKFRGDEPILKTLNKYVKIVRTEHCFLLFEELGRNDKWQQCLEVFRWMQKQRWYIADNGIYSKLISVMGKKGQIRMAMWLFSEMRNSGCRPDTSVYNALITAHLHSRDKDKALTKALGYFDKMKEIERCKPNVVTYNILMRAFAQAKNVDKVNALFEDLEKSIVSPDIYTFNGVMDGYGKNGMIREMENVLARMKINKCKPDIITFNLLIDCYGKKQEFDKMEQVFKSLLRSKERPTLPTFNSMIINYGKARQREKAEQAFKKMIDMNYKPSYVTCESLITMYGLCDCVSRAREIFDGMVNSGGEMKVSTLNTMLDVYCKNGLPVEADMLFKNAGTIGVAPRSSTYKLLYKAYTKSDMKNLVQKLLKHMERDGIVLSEKFFSEALGAFGSSRKSSKDTSSSSATKSILAEVPRKVQVGIVDH